MIASKIKVSSLEFHKMNKKENYYSQKDLSISLL